MLSSSGAKHTQSPSSVRLLKFLSRNGAKLACFSILRKSNLFCAFITNLIVFIIHASSLVRCMPRNLSPHSPPPHPDAKWGLGAFPGPLEVYDNLLCLVVLSIRSLSVCHSTRCWTPFLHQVVIAMRPTTIVYYCIVVSKPHHGVEGRMDWGAVLGEKGDQGRVKNTQLWGVCVHCYSMGSDVKFPILTF